MKPFLFITIAALALSPVGWIATQQPVFHCSQEIFGLSMHRDYYRSYFLHWCDGYQLLDDGPRPVRMKDGCVVGYGYRIIPTFTHASMKGWKSWREIQFGTNSPPQRTWARPLSTNDLWKLTNYSDRLLTFTNFVMTNESVDLVFYTNANSMGVWTNSGWASRPITRWEAFKILLGVK